MREKIEALHEAQEKRICELLYSMVIETLTNSDMPFDDLHMVGEENVLSIPKEFWTDKMHDMYGQVRAHTTIKDQLTGILGKQINPLSLGEGHPDQ